MTGGTDALEFLMAGTTLVPVCRVYLVDARVEHYGGLAIRGDAGKGTHGRVSHDSEFIVTGYLTPRTVGYSQPIKTGRLRGACIWHVEVKRLTVVRPDPNSPRAVKAP